MFVKIDHDVIYNRIKEIGPSAFTVYCYLKARQGANEDAYPRYDTICIDLNLSRGTVSKGLKILINTGLIKIVHGKYNSNAYQVIEPDGTDPKQELRTPINSDSSSKNELEVVQKIDYLQDSSIKNELLEQGNKTVVQNLDSSSPKNELTVVQNLDSNNIHINNIHSNNIQEKNYPNNDHLNNSLDNLYIAPEKNNGHDSEIEIPEKPKKQKKKSRDFDFEKFFAEFWKAYPERKGRKIGKRQCYQWCNDNVLSKEMAGVIFRGAQNLAKDQKAKDGFAPDPIRFLKNHQYEDYQEDIIVKRKSLFQKNMENIFGEKINGP